MFCKWPCGIWYKCVLCFRESLEFAFCLHICHMTQHGLCVRYPCVVLLTSSHTILKAKPTA